MAAGQEAPFGATPCVPPTQACQPAVVAALTRKVDPHPHRSKLGMRSLWVARPQPGEDQPIHEALNDTLNARE